MFRYEINPFLTFKVQKMKKKVDVSNNVDPDGVACRLRELFQQDPYCLVAIFFNSQYNISLKNFFLFGVAGVNSVVQFLCAY